MIPITIAILRYAVDVDGGMAGEPEDIVRRDRVIQLLDLTWIAIMWGRNSIRLDARKCLGYERHSPRG